MKVISWNVNGLKSIIKNGFEQSIKEINADIICVQELKITSPIKEFKLEGYFSYYNYSKTGGYSGVATFVKEQPLNVYKGIFLDEDDEEINLDEESRVLTLDYNDFFVVNVYIPHPQTKNERKSYRIEFDYLLKKYIEKLNSIKDVIICGDFNLCHKNIDCYSLKVDQKNKYFIEEVRADFSELLDIGLLDTFRYMHPQFRKYTLRANNIQKLGNTRYCWRLDYILISNFLKNNIKEANILNEIKGSDHCPIELVLNKK